MVNGMKIRVRVPPFLEERHARVTAAVMSSRVSVRRVLGGKQERGDKRILG